MALPYPFSLSHPPVLAQTDVCVTGRFVIQPDRHFLARVQSLPAIVVADGFASIESSVCPPVPVVVGTSRRGVTLHADWPACAAPFAGSLGLRAIVPLTCDRVKGVLRRASGRSRQRFSAGRIPVCGNGVIEANEMCDDGNTVDGDCCSSRCLVFGTAAGCPGVCNSNADCAPDEFCRTGDDECDNLGGCVPRPTACRNIDAPACGCDGKTYRNVCKAEAAGVAIYHADEACRHSSSASRAP